MTPAWHTRPQRLAIVVVLVALPSWWLDGSVSRSTRDVRGVVVMFETNASKVGQGKTLTVRLDDGTVVRAGNPMGALTPTGARVELTERNGLLTGMRRYRLWRVLDEGSDDPPSW